MDTPKKIPEEFIQYIWEHNLFCSESLKTTSGDLLEIINVGKRNTDSGPDFFNARIKIDTTIWAGNIEIHHKSSDWQKHNHHSDKAYENVILHVVEENDAEIPNGNKIPVLILDYPNEYKENYRKLLNAKTWIACKDSFHTVDPFVLQFGFNRLMIERLEDKTTGILEVLNQNKNDWNETFYQMLAKMFGFKVNAVPFELLAKSLPIKILAKHKKNLFQLEALLFGNSGLLNKQLLGDDYYLKLRDEYSFLYKKYNLKAIESHLWKFMRLRPVNFPTIRLSQFVALIHHSEGLFSKIIEIERLDDLKALFNIQASEYWNTHYNFNKDGKTNKIKLLGDASINTIIINVVIPFLFVYGEKQNKHKLKNRALEFIELLPPEKNSVIKNWEKLGIVAKSAFETQALLQLKNIYCEKKKCLNCQIGAKIVKSHF